MLFQNIIKKFIKNEPVIKDGLGFSKNASILIKAFEMNYGWWKLISLFWINLYDAKKILNKNNESFWKQLNWCVDFDLTEKYIWWCVIEANKDLKY